MGVEETWRSLFAKYVLKVMISEATCACKDDHIRVGLEFGINGAARGIKSIWGVKSTKEKMIFLCIDAKKAFNEII